MDPKSKDKCPYKRQKKRRHGRKDRVGVGEGDRVWRQSLEQCSHKEWGQPPATEETRKGSLLESPEGCCPANTLILDFRFRI